MCTIIVNTVHGHPGSVLQWISLIYSSTIRSFFMERNIVLAIKSKHRNNKKVAKEMSTISKMLPYIESFRAFCENNEVLDVRKRAKVSNYIRLSQIFSCGMMTGVSLYIVNKN